MNRKAIRYYLGNILRIEAVLMIPAFIIAIARGENKGAMSFFVTILLLIACGTLLCLRTKRNSAIFAREGFLIVALSWILLSFFGCLPFVFSREIPSFIDAWFETVSGFTTTGATILTNVESMTHGMLYWRSFTNWLGGMGVLVFMLALIPQSKGSGDSLHVLRAESPGPQVGKIAPKMRQSVGVLYLIYFGLTLLEAIFLLAGGMPLFDAVTTAFSTAGTGGFSIKAASVAAYESYYLQTVIAIFMILFAVNFSVYFLILMRQFKTAFRNEELWLFAGVVITSTLLITANIFSIYQNFGDALHHSFFQVASIISTTGFATVDFNLWPQFSKITLLILMIFGGCAGSTAGGIKMSRVLILGKTVSNGMKKLLHPRSVGGIHVDGKIIDHEVSKGVGIFMAAYGIIILVSILLVSLNNFSMETTISSVITCLNNIGPGFDIVGPASNFSMLSWLSKLVLIIDMLLGRLEIFPLLFLFKPSVWKTKNY